jgi:hypothetical protein
MIEINTGLFRFLMVTTLAQATITRWKPGDQCLDYAFDEVSGFSCETITNNTANACNMTFIDLAKDDAFYWLQDVAYDEGVKVKDACHTLCHTGYCGSITKKWMPGDSCRDDKLDMFRNNGDVTRNPCLNHIDQCGELLTTLDTTLFTVEMRNNTALGAKVEDVCPTACGLTACSGATWTPKFVEGFECTDDYSAELARARSAINDDALTCPSLATHMYCDETLHHVAEKFGVLDHLGTHAAIETQIRDLCPTSCRTGRWCGGGNIAAYDLLRNECKDDPRGRLQELSQNCATLLGLNMWCENLLADTPCYLRGIAKPDAREIKYVDGGANVELEAWYEWERMCHTDEGAIKTDDHPEWAQNWTRFSSYLYPAARAPEDTYKVYDGIQARPRLVDLCPVSCGECTPEPAPTRVFDGDVACNPYHETIDETGLDCAAYATNGRCEWSLEQMAYEEPGWKGFLTRAEAGMKVLDICRRDCEVGGCGYAINVYDPDSICADDIIGSAANRGIACTMLIGASEDCHLPLFFSDFDYQAAPLAVYSDLCPVSCHICSAKKDTLYCNEHDSGETDSFCNVAMFEAFPTVDSRATACDQSMEVLCRQNTTFDTSTFEGSNVCEQFSDSDSELSSGRGKLKTTKLHVLCPTQCGFKCTNRLARVATPFANTTLCIDNLHGLSYLPLNICDARVANWDTALSTVVGYETSAKYESGATYGDLCPLSAGLCLPPSPRPRVDGDSCTINQGVTKVYAVNCQVLANNDHCDMLLASEEVTLFAPENATNMTRGWAELVAYAHSDTKVKDLCPQYCNADTCSFDLTVYNNATSLCVDDASGILARVATRCGRVIQSEDKRECEKPIRDTIFASHGAPSATYKDLCPVTCGLCTVSPSAIPTASPIVSTSTAARLPKSPSKAQSKAPSKPPSKAPSSHRATNQRNLEYPPLVDVSETKVDYNLVLSIAAGIAVCVSCILAYILRKHLACLKKEYRPLKNEHNVGDSNDTVPANATQESEVKLEK